MVLMSKKYHNQRKEKGVNFNSNLMGQQVFVLDKEKKIIEDIFLWTL